jgi:hypothetical protein
MRKETVESHVVSVPTAVQPTEHLLTSPAATEHVMLM